MKKLVHSTHLDWLLGEIPLWKEKGIITPDQAGEIRSIYMPLEKPSQQNLAFYSLIWAASILCGISLLLLLGYNWDFMGYIPRLGVLFGITIAFQAGAFCTRFFTDKQLLSEILACFGGASFGISLFLIGQTFNLEGSEYEVFWWWIVGTIPVALLGQSPINWLLISLLELAWCGILADQLNSSIWKPFGWNSGLPLAPYSIMILLVPGFAYALFKKCRWTLVFQFIVIAFATVIIMVIWKIKEPILLGSLAIACALSLTECSQDKVFTSLASLAGKIATVLILLTFCYYEFQKSLFHSSNKIKLAGLNLSDLWPAYLVVVTTSILLIGVFGKKLAESRSSILFCTILFYGILLGLLILVFGAKNHQIPQIILSIVANILLLLTCAMWMDSGWENESIIQFFAGAILFLIWTFQRYFDLFGDIGGMLGASALFLACALLLVFLALFWQRKKRRLA